MWADGKGDSCDIFGQRLDFDGATIGGGFTICNAPAYQCDPRLSLFPDDGFIVVWEDCRSQKTTGSRVYARMFDQWGRPEGNEFFVSQDTWRQYDPSVAARPDGGVIISWVAGESNTTYPGRYLECVRCYDGAAAPLTAEIRVSGAPHDDHSWGVSTILPGADSGFFLAWVGTRYNTPGSIQAQRFDPLGVRLGPELEVSRALNGQSQPNIFFGTGPNITILWNAGSGFHAREFIHPFMDGGTVTTGSIGPDGLWNWTDVGANIDPCGLTGDLVRMDFSADGGASWLGVPDNGSLEKAKTVPGLRLKATLTTTDWRTSPLLRSLTVRYIVDRLPWVRAGPDMVVSRKVVVNITAESGDDDGDPLTFRWTRTGGPGMVDFNASRPWLSFSSDLPGTYRFQVIVNDGFGDSPPAFINITLKKADPIPMLFVTPLVQQVHLPVLLDASDSLGPENGITGYSFDFGNGNSSGWRNGSSVSVSYPYPGRYSASVKVRDSEGTEAESAPVRISILEVLNFPPTITSTPFLYAQAEEEWNYEVSATDPEGDNLTFQLDEHPQWLSLDGIYGILSGVPPGDQTGLHEIILRVRDAFGGADVQRFLLNVTDRIPPDMRPGCSISSPVDGESVKGKITVKGLAANGTGALLRVELRVDGAGWKTVSGTSNWRFDLDTKGLENGNHTIEARAFDGGIHSEIICVRFFVANPGDVPSIDDHGVCAVLMILAAAVVAGIMLDARRKRSKL